MSGNRNKRLYECGECKARTYIHWIEISRVARPRCRACGSARLEICSPEAKAEQTRRNQERVAGPGGSLALGANRNPRRKVT